MFKRPFQELSTFGCRYIPSTSACYLIADATRPSTNYALWLKILLLFFDYDNKQHIAEERFILTPRENDTITLDNFKRYHALETADFKLLAFDSTGGVLFNSYGLPYTLVDNRSLHTGLVLVATFNLDGSPDLAYRVRPLDLFDPWARISGLGKRVAIVMEEFEGIRDTEDRRVWVSNPEGQVCHEITF